MKSLTLSKIFYDSTERNAERPALRWKQGKEWKEMSYGQLRDRVRDFGWGLLALGMDKGDRVAIFSKNNPEWAITDWAGVAHGFVTVPIYDTLTAEKAAYILRDSGARICVVQTLDHLNKVRSARKSLPALRYIVVIEEIFEKQLEPHEYLFDQVYEQGRKYAAKHKGELEAAAAGVKADELASIVYTSGTTGEPKGAMLSHGNFASNVDAACSTIEFLPGDVALSFLPLSHVFERMAGHFTLVHKGCTIAYAESIDKVLDNLQEVKPQLMMSVPRLYEKFYARVMEQARRGSFLKRWIFGRAVEAAKASVRERYELKVVSPATQRKWKRYDRLVYHKVRDRVGGRLRFFVSGGAPLSPEIHEFFTGVGLPILQGYGLTETSPVISANSLQKGFRVGSAGKPFPGVEVRMAEDGEILARGPNVFAGYWNKKKETDEAFTKDGWFKTGDIGKLDDEGFLFITDRKKELLVMSNGKKVPPQPIENELKTQPGVGVAVLIGNNRPFVSALLAPDLEQLRKVAQEKGSKATELADLLARPEIHGLFQKAVEAVNASLSQYEKIKKFRVLPQEILPNSEILTPTLKVKRRIVDEKFKDLIEGMYRSDGAAAEGGAVTVSAAR